MFVERRSNDVEIARLAQVKENYVSENQRIGQNPKCSNFADIIQF